MTHRLSRRRFLQAAAVAALTPVAYAPGSPQPQPSERLRVAMIGTARQAWADLRAIAAAGADIAVLCDVDERRPRQAREGGVAEARQQFPKTDFVTDYRRIFDRKDIDAVAIGTPDHSHAIPTLLALQSGKHVFCEKPLTHNIVEARKVAEAAAKYKRVTQMGTQIHAGDNYRRVVELLQAQPLGSIKEVHVWVTTRWSGGEMPQDTPPVPGGLNYDLWLGPAAERTYSPAYLPEKWRGWWDFGGGTLADMACHYYDLVTWALKLGPPNRVSAEGPPVDPHSAPPWLIVHYEYAATAGRPALKTHWHSSQPPKEHAALIAKERYSNGVLFIGEKGMLLADYNKHKLLPEDQFADFKRPAQSIPKSIGHYKEWVEACKTGGPTTCHFGYSGPLTETVLLGNVAYRAGTAIDWDADRLKIPNAPEAERLLRRDYRAPWGKVIEQA